MLLSGRSTVSVQFRAIAADAGAFRFLGGVLLCLALVLPAPAPARAQAPATADETAAVQLIEVMRLDDIVSIMRREGLAYGADLDRDVLAGRGGAEWHDRVAAIYDEARMMSVMTTAMADELQQEEAAIAAALEFFGSDLGRQILSLEISAREAMLDDAVDDAARASAGRLLAERGERYELLSAFIAANDLMEQNVVGALNASLAFYLAFVEAGALPFEMPEQDVMADIWATEPEVRNETRDWLYAFLGMAYAPLSTEELARYTAFSATPEGQTLNRALFAGFDAMFLSVSVELGRAAGRRLSGRDL